MSNAVTGGSVLHGFLHRDEVGAHHGDDNGDDITAVSLNGLAVEVELPRESEVPPRSTFEIPRA
ncbi:MAG: hypothetical protein ABSF33_13555 [Acidimicrobiales bacterium]